MGHDHGDPRGDLGVILKVLYVILVTKMVVGGDSYEKCCWKWYKNHSGTTYLSMGILRITYMILMTEIVLGDDFYDKSCDSRGYPGNVIDKLCSILSHWKYLPR